MECDPSKQASWQRARALLGANGIPNGRTKPLRHGTCSLRHSRFKTHCHPRGRSAFLEPLFAPSHFSRCLLHGLLLLRLEPLRDVRSRMALSTTPLPSTFCLSAGYSVLSLIRKARSARGAERQQLNFLFVALLSSGACAIVTNLVIPLLTGSSSFSQYGPLFSVAMIAMIAHAIIRHRLMDIRLVVRQGVVYVCAIATAAAMFFFSSRSFTARLAAIPRAFRFSRRLSSQSSWRSSFNH